jgi:dihydrofolate reductase
MRAIIAVNNVGFIGLGNGMLWHSSEDFKHFKSMTIGHKLLVGYNTFQGLPKLKDREIIMDLRNKLIVDPETIDWCIGGKKTYEKYCHLFTELHISHIDNNDIGDVTFPDLKNLNKHCKIFNYQFKDKKSSVQE